MQKVAHFSNIFGTEESFKKQQSGTAVASLLDQENLQDETVSILSMEELHTKKGKTMIVVDVSCKKDTFRLTSFDIARMCKDIKDVDFAKMPTTFKIAGDKRIQPQKGYEKYAYKYEAIDHSDRKIDFIDRPFVEGAEGNEKFFKNDYSFVIE